MDQQNHIRQRFACPRCLNRKDQGLVICWSCNRALKAKHNGGWGEKTERALDALEAFLAADAKHAGGR